MKRIVECKRAIFYDVEQKKVVAILSDQYIPELSDRDILCILYSPRTMEWVVNHFEEQLWIKDSNIRVEVICEYKEIETLMDKIKRILRI